MAILRQKETVEFTRLAVDQELIAVNAMAEIGIEAMVKIIDCDAKVKLSYLVEFPNGERRWITKP